MTQVFTFAHSHVAKLPEQDAMISQALEQTFEMSAGELDSIPRILAAIVHIHEQTIQINMTAVMKGRQIKIREQMNQEGGVLFECISFLDTQFLGVAGETHGSGKSNPDDFLHQQKVYILEF